MVIVVSTEAVNVERDAGSHGETVKDVRNHFAAEVANLFALEAELGDAVGPRRDVDDGAGQGLVEGCMPGAVALDALDGPQSCLEGLSQRQGTVLGRVVVIDPQIAIADNRERHAAVLCERVEHLQYQRSGVSGLCALAAQKEKSSRSKRTWSRKPMPVFTLIT